MHGLIDFVQNCYDWAEDRWGRGSGSGCLFAGAAGLLMFAVMAALIYIAAVNSAPF